jgi:hypothetical protein
MKSRARFVETMRCGSPDRVPYFEEGIRDEVIRVWQKQGLPKHANLHEMFSYDRRGEIEPDLEPRPGLKKWPTSRDHLEAFRQKLDPQDKGRLPRPWKKKVRAWGGRDDALILWVHRGFFLSMGVDGWERFKEVMDLMIHDPGLVGEIMKIQGGFAARLAEKVLKDVVVDAALFVEPIGENHGPLISPKMYETFVLPGYEPVLDILRKYGVETIIYLTFANTRLLLPSVLARGFNCLWACEGPQESMDYRDIRREYGPGLRLIGGIDLDALRGDKETIRREMEAKVPPLLAGGGYLPLLDGRVRVDIPFENYVYYRQLLEEMTQG